MLGNEKLETSDVNSRKGEIANDIDVAIFVGECDWFNESDDRSIIISNERRSKDNRRRLDFGKQRKSSFSSFCYDTVMRQNWIGYFLSGGILLMGMLLSSFFHSHYAVKARLMQRKAPPPVRFFPRNSPVTEFYDGNGFDVHRLLSLQTDRYGSSGILFVMFYAPWCARSMEAKWHMENLARYFYLSSTNSILNNSWASSQSESMSLQGPVHFIAVNCWDPNGQCRRLYKVYSYPLFLAYPGSANAIYYNGVLSADYIFRFLENLIMPFVRLQTEEDVIDFLADTKTSVVAYFNLNSNQRPTSYDQFYATSLKALERDPLRAATKFAVITHFDLAYRFNFAGHGHIRLFRRMNHTISDYFISGGTSVKLISKWVFENLSNPIRWISPSTGSAGKSTALYEFFTREATLILFAPRQPLFDDGLLYAKLTEVALSYRDCSDTSLTTLVSTDEILNRLRQRLKDSQLQRQRLNDFCLRRLREQTRLLNDCCDDVSQVVKTGQNTLYDYRQRNICHICYPEASRGSIHFMEITSTSPHCERWYTQEDFSNSISPAIKNFLVPIFSSRSCDRLINDFLPKTSVIEYCCEREERDGSKRTKRTFPRRQRTVFGERGRIGLNCDKFKLSRLLRYSYDDNIESESEFYNATLAPWRGLACRTNRTLQFAAMDSNYYGAFARNFGLHNKNTFPAAAIIDNEKEAVYMLDGPVDIDRLGLFIMNFTYGQLMQFHRSGSSKNINGSLYETDCSNSDVCIPIVTASTFQSVVMDETKDVVLFYMASWCGSCQRLFHIYQTLAYYFRVVNRDIIFAQKSESIAFPTYAPFTLPNLVAFILAHCHRSTRLRFALSTCMKNSTGDSVAESRCLIRNRYRAWLQCSRLERQRLLLQLEVSQAIQNKVIAWDNDEENEQEWLVYLQRSRLEISRIEIKLRALRLLLVDVLRKTQFDIPH